MQVMMMMDTLQCYVMFFNALLLLMRRDGSSGCYVRNRRLQYIMWMVWGIDMMISSYHHICSIYGSVGRLVASRYSSR